MSVQRVPQLRLIEVGCDYITATVRKGHSHDVLRDRVDSWAELRKAEGYSVRGWQWQGYRGFVTDGITWGARDSDSIVRLSGKQAHRWGHTLTNWADNVSRIDVQVTLQDDGLRQNWASVANETASLDPRVQCGQTGTRITFNTPTGCSSYIGGGDSDRMMRCYDKTAESDGEYPPGCWRWEVEWKHSRALTVARQLANDRFRSFICAEAVQVAYASYGVHIPMGAISSGWRDAGVRHQSDDQRRLAYLRSSIRPMLSDLQLRYGRETILEALGMPEYSIDTGERIAASIARLEDGLANTYGVAIGPIEHTLINDLVDRAVSEAE